MTRTDPRVPFTPLDDPTAYEIVSFDEVIAQLFRIHHLDPRHRTRPGLCFDCRRRGERVTYGSRRICIHCAKTRALARERLEHAT